MKKVTKKILSVMLVVGFLGYASAYARSDNSQYINESFTSDIGKIDIDISLCSIVIETHNSNEIIVEAKYYEYPFIMNTPLL